MSQHKMPPEKRKALGLTGHFNLRRWRETHPRPPKPKPLLGDGFDTGLLGAITALMARRGRP